MHNLSVMQQKSISLTNPLSRALPSLQIGDLVNADMLQGTALGKIWPILELDRAKAQNVIQVPSGLIVRINLPMTLAKFFPYKLSTDPSAHLLTHDLKDRQLDLLIDQFNIPIAILPVNLPLFQREKITAFPMWDLSIQSLPVDAFRFNSDLPLSIQSQLWTERLETRDKLLTEYISNYIKNPQSPALVQLINGYELSNIRLANKSCTVCFIDTLGETFQEINIPYGTINSPKLFQKPSFILSSSSNLLTPYPPTVYTPQLGFDQKFYNIIIQTTKELCLCSADLKVLDIATGSGIIPTIINNIAKQSGTNTSICAYDINPIAVAGADFLLNQVHQANAQLCQADNPQTALEKMQRSNWKFDLITINSPFLNPKGSPAKTLTDLHDNSRESLKFHQDLKCLANYLAPGGKIILWGSGADLAPITGLQVERIGHQEDYCVTYIFSHHDK